MAQTVANLADVMKEVWTSDRLEKQFFDEHPLLDRLSRTSKFTHGKKAVVPIHKGRSGGYSVKNSAGGALNAADEQKVDRAEFTVPYNWFQIEIETGAINEATGGGFSVGSSVDLEVTNAIENIRNQVERQFVSNGDALIAQVTTGGATNVLNLLSTGYGFDAIQRGWLYPGLLVDVGTTSSEAAIMDAQEITAVSEDETTPSITFGSDPSGEGTTHYVSIANARAGTTSYESAGFRNIVSTSGALGTLNPSNSGEEFWAAAHLDTTTTVLSLDLLLTMQRKVMQKGGQPQTYVCTSLKQQANFYSLLQNQVRFAGEMKLGAGSVGGVIWNGLEVEGLNAIPNRELYFLTLDDFHVVTGAKFSKPTWVSDIAGNNTGMIWKQGNTSFVDAITYPIGLAISRRNRNAAATALTA